EKALVTLEIYDITGRKIQTLLNDEQEPGVYTVSWDGTNQFGEKVSSGIYFYRMAAGKFIQTRRMMLLK
ncbi:MAG: T9SS type A sorting domain-containing protein, partial [Calditrichaeota bacterium]|nr:T9SS type A sorting domain-containing protein [Calditrichota bacterium]